MLTKAFKKAHPGTPWKVIQGMRHYLVHDYANVVSATLYDTVVNDIPMLRKQVEGYLAETDWAAWASGDDVSEEADTAVKNEKINTARRMRTKGYSIDEIADITGLSAREIAEQD